MTVQLDLYTGPWRDAAVGLLEHLAPGETFTSDDLHDMIGDPPHPNHVGMVMRHLGPRYRKTGRYVPSTRPSANGRVVAVWEVV